MNPAGHLASPGLRIGAFVLMLWLLPLASFLMFPVDDENRQNWYDRFLGTFVVQKPQGT
jgi:hypothetical protein